MYFVRLYLAHLWAWKYKYARDRRVTKSALLAYRVGVRIGLFRDTPGFPVTVGSSCCYCILCIATDDSLIAVDQVLLVKQALVSLVGWFKPIV